MIVFLFLWAIIACFVILDVRKTSRCCGDCAHYKGCWSSHVEYMERNTVEHPICDDFEA